MHIPTSVGVCVREKNIERVPGLRVCANGCELLLLYVHTFVYVWVWRAVLAHIDLCQEEDVFLN